MNDLVRFNSSRYPTIPNDTAEKHDPQQNNHVVFIRKNKFFAVPLEVDGVSLSTAELESYVSPSLPLSFENSLPPPSQISQIFTLAGPTPATPLGVLTSDNRDIWTHARQSLIAASPTQNAASLKKIDAAVIIVALDDTKPVTREAISYAALSGDGRNRWFDKHQLIVFDNGRSAFLGEHSCMDGMLSFSFFFFLSSHSDLTLFCLFVGTPTLRLNEYMVSSVARGTVDHGSPTVRPNLPAPQEIKFVLDDTTSANIKVSEKNFDKLVGEHDMHVCTSPFLLFSFPLLINKQTTTTTRTHHVCLTTRSCTTKATAPPRSRNTKPHQTHGSNSSNNSHSIKCTNDLRSRTKVRRQESSNLVGRRLSARRRMRARRLWIRWSIRRFRFVSFLSLLFEQVIDFFFFFLGTGHGPRSPIPQSSFASSPIRRLGSRWTRRRQTSLWVEEALERR